MKEEKIYFADTSFLIDMIHEREETIELIETAEKVITSALCAYELNKKIRFDFSSIDEAFIRPFRVEDAEEASRLSRKMERKGEKINEIDYLIAAQARNTGIPVLTADQDFKKIDGLETIFYRD